MHAEDRKTKIVNIRLSPERKKLLQKAAATEHRTVSNLLEYLLVTHCEREGLVRPRLAKTPRRTAQRSDK